MKTKPQARDIRTTEGTVQRRRLLPVPLLLCNGLAWPAHGQTARPAAAQVPAGQSAKPAAAQLPAGQSAKPAAAQLPAGHPDARWYQAAERMRLQALSWGDQSYGAVVVLGDQLVGDGPSRVVLRADPSAHAEREAIRDAQRRLGRERLDGAVLYSTSRPCAACEVAAARAGISRMIHGASLSDAGAPAP